MTSDQFGFLLVEPTHFDAIEAALLATSTVIQICLKERRWEQVSNVYKDVTQFSFLMFNKMA